VSAWLRDLAGVVGQPSGFVIPNDNLSNRAFTRTRRTTLKHTCDVYITSLKMTDNEKVVDVEAEGTGGSHKFGFLVSSEKARSLRVNQHLVLTVRTEAHENQDT